MQDSQTSWLSRQVLLDVQDDVPAFALKSLFFGLLFSVLLIECGVPILIAAMLVAFAHYVLSRVAIWVDGHRRNNS